jgi:hypothetical protein
MAERQPANQKDHTEEKVLQLDVSDGRRDRLVDRRGKDNHQAGHGPVENVISLTIASELGI